MAFCKKAVESMAIGALALVPITAVAAEEAVAIEIFTPVGTMEDHRIRAERPGSLASLHDAETDRSESRHAEVLRSRSVVVDLPELVAVRERLQERGPVQIRLDLFSDVDLIANIARTAKMRYGYSLSGQIDGDPLGSVTLVVHGDILAGAVHSRQGNFVVSSRNGTVHAVRQVSGEFKCGVDGLLHSADARAGAQGASATASSDGDDGSEVDLLVVFTQAALEREGSLRRMRASLDLAVAWTNDAYEVSGVNLRLNMVAAVQVRYEESNKFGNAGISNQDDDLNRLVDPADGFMDEVHALRDRYAADVVHLIVDQRGGGGVGKLLRANAEDPSQWSFSISNSFVSAPALVAHELGHVMGLRHDRYTETTFGAYEGRDIPLPSYAHGYVNQRGFLSGAEQDARWRTIMAYDWQCHDEGFACRELPRFSNPEQNYPEQGGDPLGVPGDHATDAVDGPADAVRSLNETAGLVAGFRQSDTRCGYRLSEEQRDVPASGGEYSFEVDADASCEWSATSFGDFLSIGPGIAAGGTGTVSYRVDANDGPARIGYLVVAGETLSIRQSGALAPASVCGRTSQVRDAIASAVGRDCGRISEFDLLEVGKLDLRRQRIDTLDEEDFAGLTNLSELVLASNPIGSMPPETFRDLDTIKVLDLANTGLSTVPDAIVGLSTLWDLNLESNGLERISRDTFERLAELRNLNLCYNEIQTLPDGVFSKLTKLARLDLCHNRISDIRQEALQGEFGLVRLDLSHNPLGELPEDLFSDFEGFWSLWLRSTGLVELPPDMFADLGVVWLLLSDNRIEDLSGIRFPGDSISWLELANNRLESLPPGVFAGFSSEACRQRQMDLDLSGNPGVPFPLALELARVDAAAVASGPATVVVRVREGMPWPVTVRVAAEGGASFTREVTVLNGETESEPFEVAGDDVTVLGFAERPRVPGSYKGVRIALGDDLRLFALDHRELGVGSAPLLIDLNDVVGKAEGSYTYAARSSDAAVAGVSLADGWLLVEPARRGTVTVTVTATDAGGTETVRTFDVRVVSRSSTVPYMPPAMDDSRQGFVRVINHGETSAQVNVSAFDESDRAYDALTLTVGGRKTVHFNSDDLELGNEAKGLSGNTGAGAGDWRLELTGGPDIEVLSYIRTKDGFLTSMHEVVSGVANRGRVVTFNPGRNVAQVSRLRLINAGGSAAGVKIRAVDDDGRAAVEPVRVSLPAHSARSYTAAELESGAAGVEGALGTGTGKWRFTVEADRPITVMSLLESPTGHLSNLSTAPVADGGS